MWNEIVMDQLIPFHKPNKKVMSEKMIDYIIRSFLEPNTLLVSLLPLYCIMRPYDFFNHNVSFFSQNIRS
jgi:hypothetical protein